MKVSLPEVGRRGRADLTFVQQDGRTVLQDSYCEVPFKITRMLHSSDGVAHLIMMQCTAGLFGGDDVHCSIRVERGARVRITQQSATRVHPSGDLPAIQRNSVFVEAGAELQLHLEPTIPFANSRLHQTTSIAVEPEGRMSFWEGLMAGRVGRGEAWQFHEIVSETRLHTNGRLVFLDRFCLGADGGAALRWAMGRAGYVGLGLFVATDARSLATDLHGVVPEAGIDALNENTVVVRILSENGPDFHRARWKILRGCGISTSACPGLQKLPETNFTKPLSR